VEYSNQTQQLEVRLSYTKSRPISPLLGHTVDLFDVISEFAWVGFTAGSGDLYGNYYVDNWEFESYGIPLSGPPPPVLSDFSVGVIFRWALLGLTVLLGIILSSVL
jgi:hypothetical protein